MSDTTAEDEESLEDRMKRWNEEHSRRFEAECIETRQKSQELWETLCLELAKIDYYYPPHLIRLHIELLDFGSTELSEKLLKAAKAEKGISRDIIVPANMTLHSAGLRW